jgi:hypothetical protein
MHEQRGNFCFFRLKIAVKEENPDLAEAVQVCQMGGV